LATAKRRNRDEILKAVAEVDALRAGGMDAEQASDKVGIARSVYWRNKKGQPSVTRGTVRADSLPPRPKRGGKRIKRPLNLQDIGAVAHRIAVLDRKLRAIDGLVRERIRLVGHLITLLKDRKDK